jgi:tRNA-dihydrouridine synthase C
MAESAVRACELGARAVDINFGCPAPVVNRHDGGAAILRYPHRVRSIVAAVRAAVPKEFPVSAKLRLGWERCDDIYRNAEEAAGGGADWITIHARTKTQGYAPPVHWKYIGEVRLALDPLPVIANGDIWSFEDFLRCEELTGCRHFMIGRGALGDPALPHAIARHLGILSGVDDGVSFGADAKRWEPVLARFSAIAAPYSSGNEYTSRRIKQWLRFATVRGSLPWFETVKRAQNLEELFSMVRAAAS